MRRVHSSPVHFSQPNCKNMKSEQILTADLLDILFENRNKAYGAYSIRRAYPSHLKKAMTTMLLLVGVASVLVMSQPKKPVDRAVTIHLKPDHEFDKVKEIVQLSY